MNHVFPYLSLSSCFPSSDVKSVILPSKSLDFDPIVIFEPYLGTVGGIIEPSRRKREIRRKKGGKVNKIMMRHLC